MSIVRAPGVNICGDSVLYEDGNFVEIGPQFGFVFPWIASEQAGGLRAHICSHEIAGEQSRAA